MHGDGDVALVLDELERQALAGVPGDVAVHEPRARVVELEGEREVAVARERGRVPARRVLDVEARRVAVEDARGLGQDPEVVAVEVDRVGDAARVSGDPTCVYVRRLGYQGMDLPEA